MKAYSIPPELAEPARNLVDDAQDLLAATANVAEKKVIDARRRLAQAVDKAKDAWVVVQDSAVSGAKATDQAIREHPYHSMGVAFAVGVLLGLLVRRRD
jgi:ElaB/YqjD/DUF883 family membrane-anchored ribosome-binding protein